MSEENFKTHAFVAKTQEKKTEPHPDLDKNVAFFNKQMGRVRWLANSIKVEIQDTVIEAIFNHITNKNESTKRVKEYKCAVFVYPKGQGTASFVLNFHQANRANGREPGFNEELCRILNFFGQNGWLENTVKHANGTYRQHADAPHAPGATDPDDKWALFTPRK